MSSVAENLDEVTTLELDTYVSADTKEIAQDVMNRAITRRLAQERRRQSRERDDMKRQITSLRTENKHLRDELTRSRDQATRLEGQLLQRMAGERRHHR